MKKNILAICFLFSFTLSSRAQIYRFQYQISADSSFLTNPNPSDFGSSQQSTIQSYLIRHFFNNMTIKAIADNDFCLVEYIPEYLKGKKVRPGSIIPRSQIVRNDTTAFKDSNGNPEKINISIEASALDNQSLFDKQNMTKYLIQPLPKLKVTCQGFAYKYQFKKTKKKKLINNWLCNRWDPKDKSLKGKIAIWVCDTLSNIICPPALCGNCFDGGVVSVEFTRGFSFNLRHYSKNENTKFQFPKIQHCDSTILKTYNFIDEEVYKHIGLNFEYDFKNG